MNDSIESYVQPSQANLSHSVTSPLNNCQPRLIQNPLSERQSRNLLATKWSRNHASVVLRYQSSGLRQPRYPWQGAASHGLRAPQLLPKLRNVQGAEKK